MAERCLRQMFRGDLVGQYLAWSTLFYSWNTIDMVNLVEVGWGWTLQVYIYEVDPVGGAWDNPVTSGIAG